MNWEATPRARAFTPIFIALISASISSIKLIMKEINFSLSYSSRMAFVMRKLMSYPYTITTITDIIILSIKTQNTSIGFLRSITKLSERCIKNVEKLRQRTVSISSACLILILTLNELMERSIKHFSRSVLQIKIGFILDSSVELKMTTCIIILRIFYLRFVVSLYCFGWKILEDHWSTKSCLYTI